MITLALCDDEKNQINLLNKVLCCHLDLKGLDYKIQHFSNGETLLSAVTKESFDIIFLDIELGNMNGVDVAKSLRKLGQKSIIIFVTSYPDFVFQGYEVKALNYILKPYKDNKIIDVLESALSELNVVQDILYPIPLRSGTYKLNLSSTLYFYSDKRKIIAVTQTGQFEFYGKLNDIELDLPTFFVRIHQRYLININFVDHAIATTVSINQETLPISRAYSQPFLVEFSKTLLQ